MAEAFTFPVEAGKVREFAIAVLDDDNPIYWDVEHARAHGFKAPLVPPTFVQASSFWRGESHRLRLTPTLRGRRWSMPSFGYDPRARSIFRMRTMQSASA